MGRCTAILSFFTHPPIVFFAFLVLEYSIYYRDITVLFRLTKLFEDWRHALGWQILVIEADALVARVVGGDIDALRTVYAILEAHVGAVVVHQEIGRRVALLRMEAHGYAALEQLVGLLVGHHALVGQPFQQGLNAV